MRVQVSGVEMANDKGKVRKQWTKTKEMRLRTCMRACYSCSFGWREKISGVRGAGGIYLGRRKPSLCARDKFTSRYSVSRKGARAELAVSQRVGMGEGQEE